MKKLKKTARALCVALLCMTMVNNAMAAVVTYYHNDISGSPIAATDAAGNLKWKESYKPYGEKLTRSAASRDNDIGFHGKAHDDSTGLSYMGARYYDPVLGRFMGVDPVAFQTDNLHSFNRYAYTNNNPLKYVDPDGNYAFLVPLAAYALTALAAVVTVQSAMRGFGNQAQADVSIGPLSFPGADIDNPARWQSGSTHNEKMPESQSSKDSEKESRPFKGEPNSDYWPGKRADGSNSDGRRYGADGKAEVDYDFSHGNHVDENGLPLGDHAHNWDKKTDGSIRRGPACRFCPIK
ncbi:RHS domain-containing protein [Pseudomonas qingdaonensis]|uniref:RHS domain-containing protein n=1 Tax=Pseudomonas qingdaonensis TaxID=2056231 RepID=A0ABX8DRW2_9PSED|nr:RHS repeat-associated core domain-containing protein [Pseudomonas qingdaonensis]QVL18977.1 RHS domain-containing protein [Pseudomonas qingdaonensis]